MLSGVRYNPYLVMIGNHDAAWSRRAYKTDSWNRRFMESAGEYADICRAYGDGLRENHDTFSAVNGIPNTSQLESYYYDPIFYLPLGHADFLSIVLLDDFDALHHVTGGLKTTLENLTIAFAPNVKDLIQSQESQLFCELPELLEIKRRDSGSLPPLLVSSKFKMDSMAAVGCGLYFQSALYKALVIRANRVLEAFEKEFRAFGGGGPSAIKSSDLSDIRCCLLDSQGCEEIALLTFCSNLSVAFAIVSSIRCLTYQDIFDAEPKLFETVARSKLHRRLSSYASNQKTAAGNSRPAEGDIRSLCNNHVFQWSHSAVGMLPAVCFDKETDRLFVPGHKVNGYVYATTNMQICAGHFLASRKMTNPTNNVYIPPSFVSGNLQTQYFQYAVGLDDDKLTHCSNGLAEVGCPLVELSSVIENIENSLRKICVSGRLGELCGRDIFEIETELVVPVPRLTDANGNDLVFCETQDAHCAPLEIVLPLLADRLFYSTALRSPDITELTERQGKTPSGRLNLQRLKDVQRELGVPVSLRRTIAYLYQNYAILTADPFSFDIVLDLYDAFATFHAVITDHLPRIELARVSGTDPQGRFLIDENRVRSLAYFADALHNAMMHRTANGFRDAAARDMGVDFRGGLNQILLAVDAPVKCGLGVLRKFAVDNQNCKPRDTIGCVMKIVMVPGARCYKLKFGVEDKAHLAYFGIDVPHVLHPASYADYLHEAFHLLFDPAFGSSETSHGMLAIGEPSVVDRLEEIFALALWKLFVFGDDDDSFVYHNMLSFSRDIASAGSNDKETARRFVEVSLRLFFATDDMRERKGDPRSWKIDQCHPTGFLKKVLEQFV